jgi:hypothetical protein
MIARYLVVPALLLALVAGCDAPAPTTTPTTPTTGAPPVDVNAGNTKKKKADVLEPQKPGGVTPLPSP